MSGRGLLPLIVLLQNLKEVDKDLKIFNTALCSIISKHLFEYFEDKSRDNKTPVGWPQRVKLMD